MPDRTDVIALRCVAISHYSSYDISSSYTTVRGNRTREEFSFK